MFCVAFLVRTYVGTPIISFLTPRLIGKRLRGCARGLAKVVLSVVVTTPITSAFVALLFSNPSDFTHEYVSSLAVTMPVTVLVNYLIVGPAVKLAFQRIRPESGLRILKALGEHATSFTRIMGF